MLPLSSRSFPILSISLVAFPHPRSTTFFQRANTTTLSLRSRSLQRTGHGHRAYNDQTSDLTDTLAPTPLSAIFAMMLFFALSARLRGRGTPARLESRTACPEIRRACSRTVDEKFVILGRAFPGEGSQPLRLKPPLFPLFDSRFSNFVLYRWSQIAAALALPLKITTLAACGGGGGGSTSTSSPQQPGTTTSTPSGNCTISVAPITIPAGSSKQFPLPTISLSLTIK
jgi:hypothetical protein